MKEPLEQYFHNLLHFLNKKYGTYPKAPWGEEMDPILYLSYPDEKEITKAIEQYLRIAFTYA
ncbi:hypothetical protein AALF16_21390 [Bacillus cereus]|uniref:hypothetical protein n=1 Tax=Bacillus cereus TaxID=1396 RepID=UPI00356CF80D